MIQCDRTRPRCNWCHHHDLPCSFTRGRSPSGIVKAGTSGEDTTARSPLARSYQPEEPEANLLLGTMYLCNGVPFFSARGRQWIEAQTGERVALAHYTPPRRIGLLNPGFPPRPVVFLPDQDRVRSHLALYKKSVLSDIFPFLEVSLFEETIETAYSAKNDTDAATATARACIFAFMSIVCVFSKDLNEENLDTGDDYSSQAYHLLPGIFGDSMTVDGLQAILMLCFYNQTVAGDLLGVELLLSAATRFVFHLRANISAPRPPDSKRSTVAGHARKLF
ncbi:unnamed protein product [Penicillium salamii]|nr:unnamed protein product [Penicillium salamii]CAG8389077.1 unnamed protein product [Penicillium salamii]